MSTHCTLTIKLPNRNYKGIYCHFDGDIALETLNKFWTKEEDVQKLIDKGHISSLGKNISSTAFYTDRGQDLNFYSGDTIKWRELYNYIYIPNKQQWYLYKMNISDINAPYLEKTISFKYILYTTINNIKFTSDILNGVVITDSSSYSSIISSYITDIHHDLMLDYDASFVILSTECDTKY